MLESINVTIESPAVLTLDIQPPQTISVEMVKAVNGNRGPIGDSQGALLVSNALSELTTEPQKELARVNLGIVPQPPQPQQDFDGGDFTSGLTLLLKSVTRAELEQAVIDETLTPKELYLILEEGRLAIAITASTYTAFKLESE